MEYGRFVDIGLEREGRPEAELTIGGGSDGEAGELIYRGYLMAYFTSVIGTERMWTAALLWTAALSWTA